MIAHVLNLYEFEAAPICPKIVIAPRSEDSALPDLCPSLQVLEPALLSKVSDQVNKTILCKEVCHALAP